VDSRRFLNVFSLFADDLRTYAKIGNTRRPYMGSDQLARTGPYFHHQDRICEVRFTSEGDTERSFSVLVAEGYEGVEDPSEHLGLAVLDNDNEMVVFDGLASDKPASSAVMIFRLAHFESMDWSEFSETCRNNPRYRGGIPDIDKRTRIPQAGNPARQAALGLTREMNEDIRSDFLKSLHDDPETPYSFPPIDRMGIEEEICRHFCFVERNKSHIAWDIRMNMSWNRTGRMRDGTETNPEFDYDWRTMVRDDPNVIEEACKAVLEPYISGPSVILDMEEYPCEFRLIGKNKGFLIIEKFAGYFMSATRDISLASRLERLNDREIEALWGIIRVMDEDTSRQQRIHAMEQQMHLSRLEMEREARKTVS
jgi:hypothetical protein